MPTYEGLRLRVLKYVRIGLADYRKKQLKNTDFTIISNNCWGGMVYESYNLPKKTPTAGMFFMAQDYIDFLGDLREYVNGQLSFITPEKSRWKDAPQVSGDKRFGTYPIGLLSNGKNTIEIFFLHYNSEEEAKDKWTRRVQRINWEKLLVKFNDQNGCDENHLKAFLSMPFKNKVFFTCKDWQIKDSVIRIIPQQVKSENILTSYEPFGRSRYVNITDLLNTL